ncbi:sensor histidine kinase [Sphingomonas sp.]|uniref:sensor histidine kinase n=1 Tax=Sphingomonas sp. TaxID=28214 RepID=UPI0035B1030E
MRVWPRSIRGRMLALSVLAGGVALILAAIATTGILTRVVTEGIDRRLDAQIALLASSVTADGMIDASRLAVVRPALEAGPGWDWRIATPGGITASDRFMLAPDDAPAPRHDRARTRHGRRPGGAPIHAREVTLATGGGRVVLSAAAPRGIVERPIRDAVTPLLTLLGALIALLAVTAVIQVLYGLRPLRTIERAIAAVRDGRADAVPEDQPAELRPLAQELNALVRANGAALAAARQSAANLAHALKTPVAALALELRDDPPRARLVDRIDATLRHHLARARDRVVGRRPHTDIAEAAGALAATLRKLSGGRVAIDTVIAPGLDAAIEPSDFDELLGNLLDNAVRHAAGRVSVRAQAIAGGVRLCVEDDGPGIAPDARERALTPGVRLDERGDGHGFGLAIVRELSDLYGGRMDLATGAAGGLLVTVILPRI